MDTVVLTRVTELISTDPLVGQAFDLATAIHAGQTTVDGEPYSKHLLSLLEEIEPYQLGSAFNAACLLHHAITDGTSLLKDKEGNRLANDKFSLKELIGLIKDPRVNEVVFLIGAMANPQLYRGLAVFRQLHDLA